MLGRKAFINKRLGKVTAVYTHTADVYLFKTKTTMNIKRTLIHLIPLKKQDTSQLKLF